MQTIDKDWNTNFEIRVLHEGIVSLDNMSTGKTRRRRLAGAALFFAAALLEAFIARHAQTNYTSIPWLAPDVGYFVAFGLLLVAVFLAISALREQ